ncbi:MAG: YqeG family HAD IIIA-type phosphatase [Oscillospiraceae bacterium]
MGEAMIFRPTYVFKSVTDISSDFLKKNNIGGLILDLDNTLTTHNNPQPAEKVTDWIKAMKSAEIRLMIVSNNSVERVTPFAESLKLAFVANGRKPLSSGINRAQKLMGIPFENIAIVGDQVFTDVLGANLRRVRTIYVHPIELEKGFFFKLKRTLEKPFLRKIKITGE